MDQLASSCAFYFMFVINRRWPGIMSQASLQTEEVGPGLTTIAWSIKLDHDFTNTAEFEEYCFSISDRIFRIHGVFISYVIFKEDA